MSIIDRQRISAVRLLESLGYSFSGSEWHQPSENGSFAHEADELHALLLERAVTLSGGGEETPEADELGTIADALEAYETSAGQIVSVGNPSVKKIKALLRRGLHEHAFGTNRSKPKLPKASQGRAAKRQWPAQARRLGCQTGEEAEGHGIRKEVNPLYRWSIDTDLLVVF